jgi:hypothetical protein
MSMKASDYSCTGTDGGMSQKASDCSCVPLCSDCHTRGPLAYHRIGKRAFERSQGLCLAPLVARLQWDWRRKWRVKGQYRLALRTASQRSGKQ